jgi:hypothetical protein
LKLKTASSSLENAENLTMRGDIYSAIAPDVKNKIWIHTIKRFDIPHGAQIDSPAAKVIPNPESELMRKGLTMRVNATIWP